MTLRERNRQIVYDEPDYDCRLPVFVAVLAFILLAEYVLSRI